MQRRADLVVWGVYGVLLVSRMGGMGAAPMEWRQAEGYRYVDVQPSSNGPEGFTLMDPAATGVRFTNQLALARHLTNQILLNGSGVAAADVDGDGWCDLYFCGLDSPNRLYRNLGDWKFQDVTEAAGVALESVDAAGALLGDINGDGLPDLVVSSVGTGTHMFLNQGQTRFHRITPPGGINLGQGGTSIAMGDLDGDGFLDLYLANYRATALMDAPYTHFGLNTVNGQKVITHVNGQPVAGTAAAYRYRLNEQGGVEELGEMDLVLRNLGGTNFTQVTFTGGGFLDEDGRPLTHTPLDWGLSVLIRDVNGDQWPDIYVCNDFDSVDRFWINQGGMRFRAIPRLALRKTSLFSMGADFADIDRDGLDDFVVLDMRSRSHSVRADTMGDREPTTTAIGQMDNRPGYMMNTLFVNRGDGTYAEIANLAGVAATEWSWAALFLDVDLDGFEDLLVSNGNERTARSLDMARTMREMRLSQNLTPAQVLESRRLYPRHNTPNVAFHNRGDFTFAEKGKDWRFDWNGVSHGMALADLDNDGDLDVAVNNLNEAASVYRNDCPSPRLAVRLRGLRPNVMGVGATLRLQGGPVPQSHQILCGGHYLSSDDFQKTFATGVRRDGLRLEVLWRSGRRTVLTNLVANRLCEIDEASAAPDPLPAPAPWPGAATNGWFEDVSDLLDHRHSEEAFADESRQPLLTKRLSQLGPGLTWADLNQDGWDDLVIGSGKGGVMGVFLNPGRGSNRFSRDRMWDQPALQDQTATLALRIGTNAVTLLAGFASYENGPSEAEAVRMLAWPQATPGSGIPRQDFSVGPVAVADVDGDDRLDLFVGGRCVPGDYPRPASSKLYRFDNGRWREDAALTRLWAAVGMASDALFSDLDNDGDPDLVMACEWGPLRIYVNEGGAFRDATARFGFDRYTGWWNSVAAGDLDGDGRMDLVAGNQGRNHYRQAYLDQPARLYHGDFDQNGVADVLEAYYDPETKQYVPALDLDTLAKGLPLLREQFKTYQAFGQAGVEQLIGAAPGQAVFLEARWADSTLFLNQTNGWAARPLPMTAQFSPTFGVSIHDFNGDGHEDVFLAQNFFDSIPQLPRDDASCGLLLRGDGAGGLVALSPVESGVQIYGEQRGCAAADFDRDGRLDLAVAQNGAATRLLRNRTGRPGLRVRLTGSDGNPDAIGAWLRYGRDDQFGPAWERGAGGGYWSQDGSVAVLHYPGGANRLWVRWPGGHEETATVPESAREVHWSQGKPLRVIE